MNTHPHPYTIFPLGDSALTIDFGNLIDQDVNSKVIRLFHYLTELSLPGVVDMIPAYSSLTLCYDAVTLSPEDEERTAFDVLAEIVESLHEQQSFEPDGGNTISVPVCYAPAYAPDMEVLQRRNDLTRDEIIRLHTGKAYRIYMIGFLPGFAYMGEVDSKIMIARKPEPVPVMAGSVGIAGFQTGIYPFDSPGGWQIIGRTPLSLFRKDEKDPVVFKPGDQVKFYSISEDEFAHYQSRGL